MTTRFIKAVTLLACAVFSTLALADPPARVGRVSLAQGQVGISSELGDEASAALVNWPVTSHNQITTGRNARTEIRIGSTAIRLDADSSLEVSELDDDSLRLRLHHGSASVRIRNPDVLPGFELETPNGLIRMQEPGRMRVDAERARGTTVVNVFDGLAVVEDRGSQLVVRAGKRAEIRDDDVRTGLAVRDGFDDWAQLRDQRDDRSTSARYVTSEMTGYEDLDQNGIWRDDPEYGPLWLPRVVAPGWVPYRDGNWTWISPWGWTWVDNAPWGYAPFHYGRWVHVNQRWAWAPGRHIGRPVWAPALVGWIGGSGWSLSFGASGGHRARPAQGWYPLSPRDSFVPGYRLSHDHLQRINRDARPDGRRERDGRDGRRDYHREGLTVVPHEQFARRGTIAVRNAPQAVVSPLVLQNAPAAAPSAPQDVGRDGRGGDRFDRSNRPDRSERFDRSDRPDRDGMQRNRGQRPEMTGAPAPRAPVAMPAPQVVTGQPQVQPQAPATFNRRDGRDGRPDVDDRRQRPQAPPAAVQPAAAPMTMPAPQIVAPPPPAAEQGQRGRQFRGDGERRMREPEAMQAMPPQPPRQAAPPPVFHQQTAPTPAPQAVMPPPAPEPGQRGRQFRGDGEQRRMRDPEAMQAMPQQPPSPRQAAPPPIFHQQTAPTPAPQAVMPPPAAEPGQRGRQFRGDGEQRRMRDPDAGQAMPPQQPRQFAAPPVFHQQTAPAPAPVMRQAPPPAAQQAAPEGDERRRHQGGNRKNQDEPER